MRRFVVAVTVFAAALAVATPARAAEPVCRPGIGVELHDIPGHLDVTVNGVFYPRPGGPGTWAVTFPDEDGRFSVLYSNESGSWGSSTHDVGPCPTTTTSSTSTSTTTTTTTSLTTTSSTTSTTTTPPPPPGPVELEFTRFSIRGVCRNDTPYLVYEARVEGVASGGRMVLHWLDAAGRERMTQTAPLGSGEVLWPGARVDGEGNPVDWPGWIQRADGQWVEGDDGFGWARPRVRLFASMNPTSVTLGLTYPPATPRCGARPPSTLPPTGDDSQQPLVALGAALMLVGAVFMLVTRARHAGQAG